MKGNVEKVSLTYDLPSATSRLAVQMDWPALLVAMHV